MEECSLTPEELRAYRIGQAYGYHRVVVQVLGHWDGPPTNFADLLRDAATDFLQQEVERDAINFFSATETNHFMQGLRETFTTLRSIPRI